MIGEGVMLDFIILIGLISMIFILQNQIADLKSVVKAVMDENHRMFIRILDLEKKLMIVNKMFILRDRQAVIDIRE